MSGAKLMNTFNNIRGKFSDVKIHQTPMYILVISIFATFAIIAMITNSAIDGTANKLDVNALNKLQMIGDDYIDMAMTKSLARASIVARMPKVREYLAADKREALAEELKDAYEVQKNKYGAGPAQFDVDGKAYLRLHHLELFGDDVTFRPIIVQALADHNPIKGISISRSGAAMFGIAPVTSPSGKFVGVFEMSQTFDMLAYSLKNAHNIDSATFFEEEQLAKNATDMKKEVFSDKNRFGSFLKISSTNWDETAQAVTPEVISNIKPVTPFTADVDGKHIGVAIIPLNNISGKRIGTMALFDDLSINHKITSSLKITVWLMALFGAVILSGLLLVVVKGGILRPVADLSVALDSLASGKASEVQINPADYRGAVESLAISYQKLADSIENSKNIGE